MDNINKFYELIEMYELTGAQVANLLTGWHGTQLLSDDFMEYLQDEGYSI